MASFITVFLLMRSSIAMNSSGLRTLLCLSPILTSNSPDAPSPTTTIAVVFSYMSSTILTSASGTPIHRSVAIAIYLGTVSNGFSRSTNPRAITPCTSRHSLLYHLSQDVHPVCCSSLLPEHLLFFPEVTFSTLLLIIQSKTLSNSFSTWRSSVMPLYFAWSCTSQFLFHIGTIRPILHSFGILPSCIHTFSSLPVHLIPSSPAFSIISSRTSSAPVALPYSSCALLFPLLPVLSPPFPPLSPNRAWELEATCYSFSVQ